MFSFCRKAAAAFLCLVSGHAVCQSTQPGLSGMAPSKWITFRNTHSPGKVYNFANAGPKTYTYEEYFVRAWLPVVHAKNVTVLLGPNYRTEQFESKSAGENPIRSMAGWNLRSYGLDLNSFVRLDSALWVVATSHFNKSGNSSELSLKDIPLNYTVSAALLRKKSVDKEIGAGIMVNQSYKMIILPVFIFNYNFSSHSGIEMMLPKRVAWRQNLSRNDIIYLRGESVTRTYYTNPSALPSPSVYRRVDVDLGMSYNRRLGDWAGVELSVGYRKNITTKLVEGALPVRPSGLAMTLDFYLQVPRLKRKH
ncbi:hypothetical protein SAMN04487996_111301 [Dyadobacter soli]|uniref:MetA-pathway of phenol degradation n=1 Tax=Dyadobacter soli TaxID=659014 RepID=A0A1G7MM45_9BACT|nr:hypothetical protein [Dyadobacter soli]SDF62170.1 hypothetical protein SAMN04487996_111301 [Dyadobacter soli]